ncbi:MAG: FAD-binding oxidoreductase [Acidimicrobiales bacterium]
MPPQPTSQPTHAVRPAALDPRLLDELTDVVGAGQVLTDPEVVAGYAVDWTGRFGGAAPAVARPGSVAEVAEVVAACRRHGAALVPQGGNTGLVGGGVPLHGEVVLSLRRLDAVGEVDRPAGQVTAGAGVTIADVRSAAAAAGWAYGVDLGSRDSATVGGTVATNAGGLRLLRYGDTRAQVLGVEAVLGTGDVVSHLGGLLKDNTGYALGPLLCGSEGTLGVVTAVRLRLVPPAPASVVALLAFDGDGATGRAVATALDLRRGMPDLSAAELLLRGGMALVCETADLPAPFPEPHDVYLLLEVSGPTDPAAALVEAVGSLDGLADAAVGTEPPRARALWRYREAQPEAVNAVGVPPHKLDVTLPAGELAGFIEDIPAVVEAAVPGSCTWLYGHVADGNVHVNVTGPDPEDETVDDAVLQAVVARGGSISAEHGIGTAKAQWLHLNRSPAELAAFGAIKRALDPDAILNPHVLLPSP